MEINDNQLNEVKKVLEEFTWRLSEYHALDKSAEHYEEESCEACEFLDRARKLSAELPKTKIRPSA